LVIEVYHPLMSLDDGDVEDFVDQGVDFWRWGFVKETADRSEIAQALVGFVIGGGDVPESAGEVNACVYLLGDGPIFLALMTRGLVDQGSVDFVDFLGVERQATTSGVCPDRMPKSVEGLDDGGREAYVPWLRPRWPC
jgi:hypothetical protein